MLVSIESEAVVNFVGNYQDVVLDTESGNGGEFFGREDFADGIVRRVEDERLRGRFRKEGFEKVHVECPIVRVDVRRRGVLRRQKRDVQRNTAMEDDLGVVLIEERLDTYHSISFVDEGSHDGVDSSIGTASNLNLCFDIQLPPVAHIPLLSDLKFSLLFGFSFWQPELGQ